MLAEFPLQSSHIVLIAVGLFVLIIFAKTIRIVPQKTAFIVQRLGKYSSTLDAGFHLLVPIFELVA